MITKSSLRRLPDRPVKRFGGPYVARSKYRAVRTVVDGWTFDSKREAARYGELLVYGQSGLLRNLELQPKFPIRIGEIKIANYLADFRYEFLVENRWQDVIEDVKGMKTPIYRLKKKIVEALYGITIREVR